MTRDGNSPPSSKGKPESNLHTNHGTTSTGREFAKPPNRAVSSTGDHVGLNLARMGHIAIFHVRDDGQVEKEHAD